MDDDLERRQLREVCVQAMPLPGESQLRISLFQWARQASPGRILRVLHTFDLLQRRVAELEAMQQAQIRQDAKAQDDATLRAELEAEWHDCLSLLMAFYRAVRDLPGTWPQSLREAMARAEAAGVHRFDEGWK